MDARWEYDVFISHAGSLKSLARDLENDLKGIGWVSFVDVNALQPGDDADRKMIESARSAPVGLVLFDENFFSRKWPIQELKLIVESDSLLPVIVGMPFTAFEAAWSASSLGSELNSSLYKKVTRTSFISDTGGWQGELRQRICFGVTEFFIERVLPHLSDTRRSMIYIFRALKAAKAIERGKLWDLSGRHAEKAKKWIQVLEKVSRPRMKVTRVLAVVYSC